MEKKKYNKPEALRCTVDFTINLQPQSPNSTPPPNPAPTQPQEEIPFGTFINPLKWFK